MIRTQIACRTFLFFALVLLTAGVVKAQTAVDGAVAGTVVDSTGAALSGAAVLVHSMATNADTKVTSDASGYFRATRLVPGDYTVTVAASGFSSYKAEHVVVEVGRLTELTPKLSTGAASAVVEVTADTPVINAETSDFTKVFSPVEINTLPINGRHWTSFALISPGVTGGNSNFGLASFRGTSNLQNNFLVDGSDDNQSFQSVERGYTRVAYSTPEDAILEFQVLTSNVPAQYGRAVGGGVNAVTRSGANVFHGDAFYYYRDNDFGATNPFNILAVQTPTGPVNKYIKPKDKRSQYGGTFSGPAIHNKLFFLYSFDQSKRNFPIVAVPTPQFLQATNATYNNCKVAGGTTTTDAVTCAMARGVTQAQINSALAYINGQSGVVPRFGDQIINFGKVDYAINSRNNASLIYNRMRWDSPNGTQTNPVIRRGITSVGNDFVKVDSIIGKIDTLLTQKVSNELRLEYARDYEFESGDTPLANEPNTTAGGLPPGLSITPNSGFVLGTPSYVPRSSYPNEKQTDLVDNITMTLGNHTLTAGAEYRWAQDNIVDVDYLHGLFTYSLLADFFTDFARTIGSTAGCDAARDTGTGTLPCYSNLQQAFGHPQFVYHTNEYAGYVQDDWKIRHNVTLNLGVRYDYEQLPSTKIPNLNPGLGATGVFPRDKNNFAPRIGFAWDAFSNGKTLVHGAFGLFYGRIQNGLIYKALSATGSPNAQFQLNSSPTATSPLYPVIVSTATPPAISNVLAFAPSFQAPVADQFEVNIQQDLGFKTVLGIAYLGALGKQLPNFVDTNILAPTTTKTYNFTGGPLAGDKWTVPVYTTRNAQTNVAANAYTQVYSNVTSSYNALVVTLDHRLSHGVQVSASYTFSKALDYGLNQGALSDTNDQLDPFTVKPDYGRSVNDIPQRFTGSIILQPRFAIGNHYLSQAANGWTVAPTFIVQSGLPYSYGLSSGTSIPGGATTFNGSGGGNYVDFNAYPQFAATNVFNGAGIERNSARQANIDEVDGRVSRSFTLHDRYKLTLSGEVFNALNRQQFTAYNTTAYVLSGTTATYQGSFGTPSAAGNTITRERQIQFVGRFEF